MKTQKGTEFVNELQMVNEGADRITYRKLGIALKGKIIVDEAELKELQKKAESWGYDNDSLILLDEIFGYDRTGENLKK